MTHMTKPPQILIVEDEILIAMDLEDMVAEMGGTAIASAHTIQAAIKLAESIEADACSTQATRLRTSSKRVTNRPQSAASPPCPGS